MSGSSLMPLALGAISGACVSLAVALTVSADGPTGAELPAAEFDEARMSALENENAVLRARIDVLEDQPRQFTRQEFGAPTRAEFDALDARIEEILRAQSEGDIGGGFGNVDLAVEGALERREEEARLLKEQKREEERKARVARQVARWSEQLALSSYQEEEMTSLLNTRDLGLSNLKASVASGDVPGEAARESWQEIERDYSSGLSDLLSPSQWETYQSASAIKR